MSQRVGIRSERGKVRRAIVVGSGVAGLSACLELCAQGVPVLLISRSPARRAHSSTDNDGLAAALDTFGEGDSAERHLAETLTAGEFLAHQPPVAALVGAAPDLLFLLERAGVPFDCTAEGPINQYRALGSRWRRVARAGALTGPSVLRALDEQVHRWEQATVRDERGVAVPGEQMVQRLERWDVVGLVLDDNGVTVGVVAQDLTTQRIKALPADAVCLATGGFSGAFAGSTASAGCMGSAAAMAFANGAVFANPEMVQLSPLAVKGAEKSRTLGEAALIAGGRLWIPRDPGDKRRPNDVPEKERDYFLERAGLEAALPDVVARAVLDLGDRRVDGQVYLDLTHLDAKALERQLGHWLERHRKHTGTDPRVEPVLTAPAVSHTLGGLWVDYEADANGRLVTDSPRNHATSLPGLYAAGEVEYQYHGAALLGGNLLAGKLFAGKLAGSAMAAYRGALARSALDLPGSLFEKAEGVQQAEFDELMGGDGRDENPFALADELADDLSKHLVFGRGESALGNLLQQLSTLAKRANRVNPGDRALVVNQGAVQARDVSAAFLLVRLAVSGAIRRAECRGSHYVEIYAKKGRDDDEWLRSSLFAYVEGSLAPIDEVTYECAGRRVVASGAPDTSLMAPTQRVDGTALGRS